MGQYVSTLNNILTPEQQQMWQQQVGQPFTFSPTLFMNQQMPEGNVGTSTQTGTVVPRGSTGTTGTTGTTQGTVGTRTATSTQGTTQGTQTPTGTQATQGSTTQGTTTQGGTVR
jgi:hypothetical protein